MLIHQSCSSVDCWATHKSCSLYIPGSASSPSMRGYATGIPRNSSPPDTYVLRGHCLSTLFIHYWSLCASMPVSASVIHIMPLTDINSRKQTNHSHDERPVAVPSGLCNIAAPFGHCLRCEFLRKHGLPPESTFAPPRPPRFQIVKITSYLPTVWPAGRSCLWKQGPPSPHFPFFIHPLTSPSSSIPSLPLLHPAFMPAKPTTVFLDTSGSGLWFTVMKNGWYHEVKCSAIALGCVAQCRVTAWVVPDNWCAGPFIYRMIVHLLWEGVCFIKPSRGRFETQAECPSHVVFNQRHPAERMALISGWGTHKSQLMLIPSATLHEPGTLFHLQFQDDISWGGNKRGGVLWPWVKSRRLDGLMHQQH